MYITIIQCARVFFHIKMKLERFRWFSLQIYIEPFFFYIPVEVKITPSGTNTENIA